MRFLAIREILILVGLAFLPGLGQAIYFRERISWQSPVPASESVTIAQAQSWGNDAIWIDARPDEEFALGHVPGAVQLNEDRWNELLPQMLQVVDSPEKRVVVYCSSKSCNLALEIARRLRKEAQLKNVFVLEGGWEAWLKARK